MRVITGVRAARSEIGVPAGAKLPLGVREAGAATRGRLNSHREALIRLARLEHLDAAAETEDALQVVVDEATFVLPLAGVIDLEQERLRLDKALAKADGEIGRFDQKLANAKFLDRAPPAVIEEQRARRAEALQVRDQLKAARARLAS